VRNIKLCWFAGQVLFVWGMLGTDRQQCGTWYYLYMRSSSIQ
jgi:hypothetical protein